LEKSQHAEIIKFELSENKKDIQKSDDPATILAHIIRTLQRLPEEKWQTTMDALASSYANTHQDIRRIVESKTKVKLLVRLFSYPYFQESVSVLSPAFFNKLYRVNAAVCAFIPTVPSFP
jgi:hypothetical protein